MSAAGESAADDAAPIVRFGGLTPSEAARKRWSEKRAREQDDQQAQAASARTSIELVRVTVEVGKVIDRLAADARNGNTQAARELREWLARSESESDTSVSALDRATRQRMKARLLNELAQEGHSIDPSPQEPMPIAHGTTAVDIGAAGQLAEPEDEAHPADAGTPVDATP